MRYFTVHELTGAPEKDPVLVRDGFHWTAFLFGFLWALWHRMWVVAAVLLGIDIALEVGLALVEAPAVVHPVLWIGVSVLVGSLAGDLRRWTLERYDYLEVGVVAAPETAAAWLRWAAEDPIWQGRAL